MVALRSLEENDFLVSAHSDSSVKKRDKCGLELEKEKQKREETRPQKVKI